MTALIAIDTSGPVPVTAAAQDGALTYTGTGTQPRAHAEELGPMLLAAKASLTAAPSHIVVGRGPGAYTGLRVGIAAARTLAWTYAIPVLGLCSLDIVAAEVDMFSGCVVTDARRGELYWARYIDGVRVRGPEVAGRSELGHLPSASLGDVELLGDPDRRHSGDTVLSASVLGACAIQLVARHSRQGGSDPAVPEPIYLRRPDIGRARG